jgi:hypothetical protein
MYTDTSGKLARDSETTVPTVNKYARLGKLDYIVASNGVKLFRAGQAELVRELKRNCLMGRAKPKRSAA